MPHIAVAKRAAEMFGDLRERGITEFIQLRVIGDENAEQQIRVIIDQDD